MSAKKRGKPVKPAKTTKVAKKAARKAPAAKKKAGKSAPRGAAKKATKKTALGGASKAKKAATKGKGGKGAPKRSAAKGAKAAPKKVASKKRVTAGSQAGRSKPATRAAAPRAKTVSRRDATGHLDPQYAADLRALSVEAEEPETERAFVEGTSSTDGLAEELGEEFVASATSGEDDAQEKLSEDVAEDDGGPFVVTTGGTEFAEGTDASNPEEATKEPFPKT